MTAIIVPFRDAPSQGRRAQLDRFVPHLTEYLRGVDRCKIFVMEQSADGRKFNRGKLLNAGFSVAKREGFDTLIFHDVDLLPRPSLLRYYTRPMRPGDGCSHIARCWSRYNENPDYLGGIVSISAADFERVDGFPNKYWGWGGEDDEFALRIRDAGLPITSPPSKMPDGGVVDLEGLGLKEKLAALSADVKCMVKWELAAEHASHRRDPDKPVWWGLAGSAFKITNTTKLSSRCDLIAVTLSD